MYWTVTLIEYLEVIKSISTISRGDWVLYPI